MSEYNAEKKRIIGFFGHHGCGKTTLMDDVLVNLGLTDRIGQRHLDKDPVEKEKGATFSNHIFSFDLDDSRMYFFDTPGSLDFIGDIQIALNAVDNVVIVINASAGVEVTTERIWNMARELNKPIVFYVNQMDKEEVNFGNLMQELKESFEDEIRIVPFQVPIGEGSDFKGVINLLSNDVFIYEEGTGKSSKQSEIPDNAKDYLERFHSEIIEDIVETNEELMEKYFESGEEGLSQEELISSLHKAYDEDKIIPVFIGSALKNIGFDQLIKALMSFGMTPLERKFHTEEGSEISSQEDGQFLGIIVKNEVDPFVGKLTYLRVISGSLKAGSSIYIVEESIREKISHINIPRFDKNEEVEVAGVGDILVIPKLKSSKINQTVSSEETSNRLKLPEFPEPMISKSIAPNSKNEIDKITESLAKIAESDPTFKWEFDAETGETVISGMGTIHLEIMIEKLKKNFGIDFEVGKPKLLTRKP